MRVWPILILVFAMACVQEENSPESALKDFVDTRFDKVVDRSFVAEKTSGKLKLALEAMDDAEFMQFTNLKPYKRESFKIISKSCQEKRCYMTYSINYYQSPTQEKGSWTSDVKKIAELEFMTGKWYITDITNIKTYHETSQAIEVTP